MSYNYFTYDNQTVLQTIANYQIAIYSAEGNYKVYQYLSNNGTTLALPQLPLISEQPAGQSPDPNLTQIELDPSHLFKIFENMNMSISVDTVEGLNGGY